eukprot:CAMPEP_0194776336 /NCGR_PEP_ID=MMETSP0323_2-20130528/62801_1 /TAXON_ID=2866 ORGANISM="Crypthecodinium cohnii, Strain Seligo" /NCGR_SAMPLE_ID=MMETSP0323_2 /ASSEMBLY_ACC=CAM_ASM_000346 /LENGTH=36 /DNA_ID= /DNA_START= /DNA_END= /DNA_ORIENTATION=
METCNQLKAFALSTSSMEDPGSALSPQPSAGRARQS